LRTPSHARPRFGRAMSAPTPPSGATNGPSGARGPNKLEIGGLRAWFGATQALHDIDLVIPERAVTAIIGPSGCGKSTFIRCLNRMHETVPGTRVEGRVLLDGQDIYATTVDPVQIR